jgi:Uma2 family endonuclease
MAALAKRRRKAKSPKTAPGQRSPEGYLETIFDLVVEIRSKNDTDTEIAQKVKDYLKAGVSLVWVADPEAKTVTAHRRGRRPKVFREADALAAEDIAPGFRVLVSDVFQL